MALVKSGSRYNANYYKLVAALTDTMSAKNAAENQLVSLHTLIKGGATPSAAVQEIFGISLSTVQADAKGGGSAKNSFAKYILIGLSKLTGDPTLNPKLPQPSTTVDERRGIIRVPNVNGGDFVTPSSGGNNINQMGASSSKLPMILGGAAVVGLLGYALMMPKKGKKR